MSYMTTAEIAGRLRVDVSTVRRMIRAGRIPSVKIGRQYRVERAKFEIWLEAMEVTEKLFTAIESLA